MACPCFFGLLHDALDFGIDSRDCRSRGTLCVEDRAAEITRRGVDRGEELTDDGRAVPV
jgi:hypothetical protein